MRNITDIFEAAASQTALNAKIKEICGEKGVYDTGLKAWVYEPVNPIYTIRVDNYASLETWGKSNDEIKPIVCGLMLSNRGKCSVLLADAYEEGEGYAYTYKELSGKSITLSDYHIKIDKSMLKDIIEAILNYKVEANTYSSPSIDKTKKPTVKVKSVAAAPVKTAKLEVTTMTPPEIFEAKMPKANKLKLIEQLPESELLSTEYIVWMQNWFIKNVKKDRYHNFKRIYLNQDNTSNNWNAWVTEVFYSMKTKRLCVEVYVQGSSTDCSETVVLGEFMHNLQFNIDLRKIEYTRMEMCRVMKEIYRAMIEYK